MIDVTLSPAMYDVLRLVPVGWVDERRVEQNIWVATGQSLTSIRGKLKGLRNLKLIEHRPVDKPDSHFEVRRIGKE